MKISFEEYCADNLDLQTGLMSQDELINAKKSYQAFVKSNQKKQEVLEEAKKSRKLAKFYGGKALTGSPAQKKWAEEIRNKVLESKSLSDEQKTQLVKLGGFTDTSRFWINNKDKSASLFNPENILLQNQQLLYLYNKHYDTLARTGLAYNKELARKEIYQMLSSIDLSITFDFPNCDFYDNFGKLKPGMSFQC